MGSIGKKKSLGYKIPSEPFMLNDPKAITSRAKEEGFLDPNGKLDIKEFIIKNYPEIDLILKPLDSNVSGELICKNGKWTMIVNTKHPLTRQRFTMSHELGHYVSHRQKCTMFTDSLFYRKNEKKDPIEYQADKFAAEILMPEEYVKNAIINKGVLNVDNLAALFGVSGQAMLFRLKDLNYTVNE